MHIWPGMDNILWTFNSLKVGFQGREMIKSMRVSSYIGTITFTPRLNAFGYIKAHNCILLALHFLRWS